MQGKFGFIQGFLALLLGAMLFSLTACGGEQVGPTAAPSVPTALPTIPATPAPSPTPVPTATLAALLTTEWGSVKAIGAEVKASPDTKAATLEKLGGFTIVAWQRKLPDGSWLERAGGGWLQRQDVVVYATEGDARKGVPAATLPPTSVPTYNAKPATIGNPAYTYAPISGPGSIPQLITKPPVPPTPTPTIGTPGSATVAATNAPSVAPTATPRFTAPPQPTVRPGTPNPPSSGN